MAVEDGRAEADYAAAGFQRCGPRAVRLDMLERLADLIREARKADAKRRFAPDAAMASLLGCSHEELRLILKALGYKRVRKADAEAPELYAGRARSLAPQKAQTPPSKAPETPFAALSALRTPAPPPRRAGRAKRARRRTGGPDA